MAQDTNGAGRLYQNKRPRGSGSLPSSVRGQVALDRRTSERNGEALQFTDVVATPFSVTSVKRWKKRASEEVAIGQAAKGGISSVTIYGHPRQAPQLVLRFPRWPYRHSTSPSKIGDMQSLFPRSHRAGYP